MMQLQRLSSVGLFSYPGKRLAPIVSRFKPICPGLYPSLGISAGTLASSVNLNRKPQDDLVRSVPSLPSPPPSPVSSPPLRVVRPLRKLMSYNAQQFYNSGKGKSIKPLANVQALAEAIQLEDPDVIALQEVGDRKLLEDFNHKYLNGQYPNIVTGHVTSNSPMQVAFMSKANMHVVQSKSHWQEISKTAAYGGKRDFLEATFKTDTGYQFTVYNAHCKSMRGSESATMPVRLQEVTNVAQILRRHFKREPKANVFLTGDFNTLHQSPYGKPVIETLTHIRQNATQPDLTEVMLKDGKADPTHSGHGLYPDSKLDYIFVSEPLVTQVTDAYVAGDFNREPWSKASDHRPYVTVFAEPAVTAKSKKAQPETEEVGKEIGISRSLKRKLDRIA